MQRGQDSGVGENINSGFISLEESTLDSLCRISGNGATHKMPHEKSSKKARVARTVTKPYISAQNGAISKINLLYKKASSFFNTWTEALF